MQVTCDYCKERLDKLNSVKVNRKYYHKNCYKMKRIKKHIFYILTNKKKVVGLQGQIRGKINEHLESYEYLYILFVLRKKINLNHINGLVYFLQNEQYKKEFIIYKSKKIKVKKSEIKIVKNEIFQIKNTENKKWGDSICCHSIQTQKQE